MFRVGSVTHFYDKLGLAIVELDAPIAIGDIVKFVKDRDELFSQTVVSIQVGYEKKDSAKKGDVVGIKVKQEVGVGDVVYKTV